MKPVRDFRGRMLPSRRNVASRDRSQYKLGSRLNIVRTIADSKTSNRRNGLQTNVAQHESVSLKEMSMVGVLTVSARNGEF